jgi:hypothetical protein
MLKTSRSTILISLAKKLKLGKLKYKLYYAPKNLICSLTRKDAWIDLWSQLQMERAIYNLSPLQSSINKSTILNIYFLTGEKYWYQTCFCAYSMSKQIEKFDIRPIIYDDGSLDRTHQNKIIRILPNAKFILRQEIEEKINKYLPENKFPYLRERRINYPNIRKLTDIHVGSYGWKLVLDSDMLFFRTPHILLDWLKSPKQPCHMVDVETSYGYSSILMETLADAKISELINVGICGLKSDDIDWEKLEYWCKTMIKKEGKSYYQEQALVAMLMAGKSCIVSPASDYIVMPDRDEVIEPKAILHHYVADSKSWYFRYGWRHILKIDP